ncbi:MAG: xylulokinase [Candidatus Coproplasma sp.]
MSLYVGIDLGTSGVKLLLVDEKGKIHAEANRTYEVEYPRSGWTQQNPNDWFCEAIDGLEELIEGRDKAEIKGISFGGQMHGLVALDKDGEVIRPCILWNDGRCEEQTEYLNTVIGRDKLSKLTGNIAFAGFTAPKLLWLKQNEPLNFNRIAKFMLPKDYLAYKFSGEFCTDYSDASGTLLLDVKNKRWSEEMCVHCGISPTQLPKLYESFEVVGTIKSQLARKLGLLDSVKIIAGAGDNSAGAIGTGAVNEGDCNISLGTSGTIFIPQNSFSVDSQNALHSFCHANGKWHLMGCILSAGSCRAWWLEDILGTTDYVKDEKEAEECQTEGLYFLPYLSGERSPHNDVNAKGAFIGLSATTTRAQMSKAVMEGVAFALRDCFEVAKANGIDIKCATLCGGGAKSSLWRKIVANVLNLPVTVSQNVQGPAYGSAILAMVGCGEYESVQSAVKELVCNGEVISPDPLCAERYNKKYQVFKGLYPLLKQTFAKMQ